MPAVRTFEAPVREVTLLEDRASVLRRGSVELPAGRTTLRIQDVAPVLADKTCTAAFGGAVSGATVDDLRVRRTWVPPEDRAGTVAELEATLRELRERRDRMAADNERLQRRGAQQDELLQLTLGELSDDVAWGRTPSAEWRTGVAGVTADARSLRDQVVAAAYALADLDAEIQRVAERCDAARGGDPRKRAWVEIDVTVLAAGTYELRCEYVVPGACWRPRHTARLAEAGDGTARVHWACEGSAWQHTGEDWNDVLLRFSTQRLSLGAEPPRLGTDELHVQPKAAELEVEAREEKVHTTGLGASATRAAPEVPGVDDGGRALTLTSATAASIPSDGRPYRVPLFAFTADAEVSRVALPELATAVLWKSVQANGATEPLLAGPVELVRRHGVVGRTTVLYVAPGERFELGWGPDPELRVVRSTYESQPERGMLSSWTSREQHVTLRFSNLADAAVRFTVKERVPVSEIEKVQIEPHPERTTDRVAPDADGFVTWTVEVPPFDHATLELRYTVKTHKDVVWH